jgi:hypothetical protein
VTLALAYAQSLPERVSELLPLDMVAVDFRSEDVVGIRDAADWNQW